MKNLQKGAVVPLIVIAVLVIGGGIYYYLSKNNNWSCALDSQGTKHYVLKVDLDAYSDKLESYQESQFTNDMNIVSELRNRSVVYAEDSNNCYGKHVYKVKNDDELVTVDLKAFNEYLSGEKFNKNFCENAVLIQQSGNSPFFIKNQFCTI